MTWCWYTDSLQCQQVKPKDGFIVSFFVHFLICAQVKRAGNEASFIVIICYCNYVIVIICSGVVICIE